MIPAGVARSVKEWITIGLNEYFPAAGTYEIQAKIADSDGRLSVESNKIYVQIQEPIGSDRAAYNLIKNSGFKDYLFSGDDFDKTKGLLESIVTRFPDSTYVHSTSFTLGEKYFKRQNLPQALIHLQRLEANSEFFFVEKVRNYLTEIRRAPLTDESKEP